jgi:hypothetical protein
MLTARFTDVYGSFAKVEELIVNLPGDGGRYGTPFKIEGCVK